MAIKMGDKERRAAIAAVLDRMEAVMRGMQLWERERPEQGLLESRQPFCYDTLKFHQWLQWLFIPRMRGILAAEATLPERSAIGPYAEDCIDKTAGGGAELLALIERFDALIAGGEGEWH